MADALQSRDRDRPTPAMLLAEAGVAMLAASLAVRLMPFDRLARGIERTSPSLAEADAATAYWIRRSVRAWGRRLPWRAKCFEQGLAASWMLRRRKLGYSLHYGAANRPRGIDAHVWVTSGDQPVVGHESRDEFAALARFDG
jgi:hypothetical protein